jgi:poly-gamma-glutamate capsule biosynthesis protein CapA/YwtB (metallophosphatase superfamily)
MKAKMPSATRHRSAAKNGQAALLLKLLVAAVALSGFAFARTVTAQEKVAPGDFNLTLTGDAIILTGAKVHQNEPRFMAVVKAIRQGDAAFTNLEEVYPSRNAYPAATSGNTWMAADPSMVKELQWMGLNLFGTANNHSYDYGIQGVLDTIDVLKQDGAVFAGTGSTLGEARQPGYLTTSRGRIALISCTSSFLEAAPAGDPRPDLRGRPGINPLHHSTTYFVTPDQFAVLSKIRDELKLGGGGGRPATEKIQAVTIPTVAVPQSTYAPIRFESADEARVETKPDPKDLAAIGRSIKDAREMASYVVTSIHSHEGIPGPESTPAEFLVDFAHAAIDQGSDVVVGHGPHVLRGIEIYKGKVIFYSLGDFWWQDNLILNLPSDFYSRYNLGPDAVPSEAFDARGFDIHPNLGTYQSVVARVSFRDGHPEKVTLTPIVMTLGPRPDEGVPLAANPTEASEILAHLQKLSQPYGTNIVVAGGEGVITIGETRSK